MLKVLPFLFLSLSYLTVSGLSSNPRYITVSDKYHIVQNGDTIEAISSKHNIPVRTLKLYNNLPDSQLIVGQKIYLQPADPIKQEYVTKRAIPPSKYHVVKRGETLTRIAKMYDIYLFDLVEFNRLGSLEIENKQKIWLEAGHAKVDIPIEKPSKPAAEKKLPMTQESPPIAPKQSQRFIMPTSGTVTSEFGMRGGRPHKGIDIAAPPGTPIYAVAKGKVLFSSVQRGYGNVIMIEHGDNAITVYAHNEANLVREGDSVQQGQPIARVGNTGISTGPHLHFEVRVKGKAHNPRHFLPDF